MFLTTAVAMIIQAADTGQIKGKITDKDTGDPIIGASVLVLGTKYGAMTGIDGTYLIKRVPPGIHTLRISNLDHNTLEISDIRIVADSAIEVNAVLEKKIGDIGKTIKVVCDQDMIDKFQVSNQVVITADAIKIQPVTSVDELLETSGKVEENKKDKETFIRGGRAGEVTNGVAVPVGDPLGGINYSAVASPQCAPSPQPYPPAHGGNAIVNGKPFDAMFFENYGVNPFVDTEDDHLSTFAIDVDDASYVLARSYLERGALPDKDAVRTEEFVNHFDYNYDSPEEEAFSVNIEGAPSRFGQNCSLVKIGIKGREVRPENRKPANLVFVVDISGSMAREDRLGLVRKALRLLVDELTYEDKVGIVVYGSNGMEWLPPTSLHERNLIINAIEMMHSGGSTNAEEGIRLGYNMADRMFRQGYINRVILCSDGVANVGQTGPDDILKMIKMYADKGITLTTVGFGMGNYNDVLMEKLGNKGNGFYAYVDNLQEARGIFVDNLTGTLQVIARDVKIQVDFDPRAVRSYRLLGYENRDVADNKFRDDKEDGGEIGSGHEVTALYEVKLQHAERPVDRIGTVYVRYKDPDSDRVTEVAKAVNTGGFASTFSRASDDLKLAAAAAEFAEILRKSYWAKESSLADVMDVVKGIAVESESSEVIELMSLINKAQQFDEQLTQR